MKKSDKKLDNQIRLALNELCESHLKSVNGFEWLTHQANFARFPESLMVVCVFNDNESLAAAKQSGELTAIESRLISILNNLNIKLNKPTKHFHFDTEQNCTETHAGNWAKRLQSL